MTYQEAASQAIKETKYCFVLACVWEGIVNDSVCLERIFTKTRGQVEIRLAWWKGGRQATRPADIDAINWIILFDKAVQQGVFNDREKQGMLNALKR